MATTKYIVNNLNNQKIIGDLDIQGAFIDENVLKHYITKDSNQPVNLDYNIFEQYLKEAKRPIVIAGYGIHLADAKEEFIKFIEKYNLPVTFTYLTIDLLPSNPFRPFMAILRSVQGDPPTNISTPVTPETSQTLPRCCISGKFFLEILIAFLSISDARYSTFLSPRATRKQDMPSNNDSTFIYLYIIFFTLWHDDYIFA
jgi:hypothetical protein